MDTGDIEHQGSVEDLTKKDISPCDVLVQGAKRVKGDRHLLSPQSPSIAISALEQNLSATQPSVELDEDVSR